MWNVTEDEEVKMESLSHCDITRGSVLDAKQQLAGLSPIRDPPVWRHYPDRFASLIGLDCLQPL